MINLENEKRIISGLADILEGKYELKPISPKDVEIGDLFIKIGGTGFRGGIINILEPCIVGNIDDKGFYIVKKYIYYSPVSKPSVGIDGYVKFDDIMFKPNYILLKEKEGRLEMYAGEMVLDDINFLKNTIKEYKKWVLKKKTKKK